MFRKRHMTAALGACTLCIVIAWNLDTELHRFAVATLGWTLLLRAINSTMLRPEPARWRTFLLDWVLPGANLAHRLSRFKLLKYSLLLVIRASGKILLANGLSILLILYYPQYIPYPLYLAFYANSLWSTASAFVDVGVIIWSQLLGCPARDRWYAPHLSSTSPREFWSRRWNKLFKGCFHDVNLTQVPWGTHSWVAAMMVFLFGGLMHDLVLYVTFRRYWCTLPFFVLHGAFVLIQLMVEESWPKASLPAPIARLATLALMLATSPLLLTPYMNYKVVENMVNYFPLQTDMLTTIPN
eukprot:NODE_4089_length_1233_cov_20.361261_g3593_i0.p1 GENE.NODE_4089_length_1233_cov_20.361261_g3593_i0~~NODE_4089_length_1233_cov_20.361261_g3593_i0.p1  ORF type:complete len:298 (-),score=32.59 NODE_4089_length_1233_cov_20.361261_g3593_i0:252-1145(-)